MFEDIGKKIKDWAKSSYVIGTVVSILAGIIFFLVNEDRDITWVGFLIMFGGVITVSAFSTLLYAFGQFVDDIHAIRNKYAPLTEAEVKFKREAEEKLRQEASEKAKQEEEKKAKHEAEERDRRKAVEKVRCEVDKTTRGNAENEQLSISDIESAASAYLNRRISVSDISCTLIYVIPEDTGIPKEMHLDMSVGDQEFTSLDLFFDQNRHSYYFKGRRLALDGAWRSEEEIFDFNVSLFKEFNTEVDEDD